MPKTARVGDFISISCAHGSTGCIVGHSNDIMAEGALTAREGDSTICLNCGQSGRIVSGSPNVFSNSKPTARVDDPTVGSCDMGLKCCPHSRSGSISSGAATINVNDFQ